MGKQSLSLSPSRILFFEKEWPSLCIVGMLMFALDLCFTLLLNLFPFKTRKGSPSFVHYIESYEKRKEERTSYLALSILSHSLKVFLSRSLSFNFFGAQCFSLPMSHSNMLMHVTKIEVSHMHVIYGKRSSARKLNRHCLDRKL